MHCSKCVCERCVETLHDISIINLSVKQLFICLFAWLEGLVFNKQLSGLREDATNTPVLQQPLKGRRIPLSDRVTPWAINAGIEQLRLLGKFAASFYEGAN